MTAVRRFIMGSKTEDLGIICRYMNLAACGGLAIEPYVVEMMENIRDVGSMHHNSEQIAEVARFVAGEKRGSSQAIMFAVQLLLEKHAIGVIRLDAEDIGVLQNIGGVRLTDLYRLYFKYV